jgi:hypothetical protein
MLSDDKSKNINIKEKEKPPGFINGEDGKINHPQSQADVDKDEQLLSKKFCVSNIEMHTTPQEVNEISQQVSYL